MSDMLIRNADVVVTMNARRAEIARGDVYIRDGVILAVGTGLAACEAEVIDAAGCVVTPGLVNTHHHLYQTLTRAVPGGQDALLFGWLKTLYPIWARFGPEEMFVSAQVGLAELALSGCTMTSDHLYLYPNGARLDDTIAAAEEVGLRFHPTRGAMSIGESAGGLPPDSLVEKEPAILEDMIRVVDRFHDPKPGAMVRVGLAPCSPFSVSRELMRDAALLARDKRVMLHTHLAENDEDVAYSLAQFGCRPGQYAEDLGWTGADVWHAHCVKLDGSEIELFSRSRRGLPIVHVRIVDSDPVLRRYARCGTLGCEWAWGSTDRPRTTRAIWWRRRGWRCFCSAWRGGPMRCRPARRWRLRPWAARRFWAARTWGRSMPGKRADLAVWDMRGVEAAGSWDPVAALVLCGPTRVRHLIVEGRQVVRDGQMLTLDLPQVLERQRQLAARLAG
jgi:cytosine/adenosine deaminase-related metal-dependent hydrolase